MTHDALIVGFGPVGAALANLLARRGLRVAVVEAEAEVYAKPRAIVADRAVMRVFQACGLAKRIAPFTTPHPGTHYLGVNGRVIKKVESLPPPHPLGWPPTISLGRGGRAFRRVLWCGARPTAQEERHAIRVLDPPPVLDPRRRRRRGGADLP